ncbi:MAG: hypothetical protein Q8P30_04065 [Candidatus Uhrbacteria bacterium]|nr:hypothetical protein [Candidatus Uhrbacteria bacterium]
MNFEKILFRIAIALCAGFVFGVLPFMIADSNWHVRDPLGPFEMPDPLPEVCMPETV